MAKKCTIKSIYWGVSCSSYRIARLFDLSWLVLLVKFFINFYLRKRSRLGKSFSGVHRGSRIVALGRPVCSIFDTPELASIWCYRDGTTRHQPVFALFDWVNTCCCWQAANFFWQHVQDRKTNPNSKLPQHAHLFHLLLRCFAWAFNGILQSSAIHIWWNQKITICQLNHNAVCRSSISLISLDPSEKNNI